MIKRNVEGRKAVELDDKVAGIIEEAIPLVFKRENMVSFIRASANNYLQDYRNQILIWRQREDAMTVASKKAISKLGLSIPDSAKPVTVMYPVVVCTYEGRLRTEKDGTPVMDNGKFVYDRPPEFKLKFKPVFAYDLKDVETSDGRIQKMEADIDIGSAVRGNIAFWVEEDGGNEFIGKGAVDYVNGRFLLKRGLSGAEKDRIFLELFTDYILEMKLKGEPFFKERLSDKGFSILGVMLKAGVLAKFDLLAEGFSAVSLSEAERMGGDEKRGLLMCFNLGLMDALSELTGRYLSFDETAICNCLLRQDKEGRVQTDLIEAPFSFRREDGYFDQVMKYLAEGLRQGDEGRLRELCGEIKSQSLMTYPPYPFPMKGG